jgi:hypothetical protein
MANSRSNETVRTILKFGTQKNRTFLRNSNQMAVDEAQLISARKWIFVVR